MRLVLDGTDDALAMLHLLGHRKHVGVTFENLVSDRVVGMALGHRGTGNLTREGKFAPRQHP